MICGKKQLINIEKSVLSITSLDHTDEKTALFCVLSYVRETIAENICWNMWFKILIIPNVVKSMANTPHNCFRDKLSRKINKRGKILSHAAHSYVYIYLRAIIIKAR